MNTILNILKMIPALISVVKAAEEAFPLPGSGKAKLDFVLALLSIVETGVNQDMLTKLIAVIVGHLFPHPASA
mgnify:CR=1 FL=1